MGFLKLLGALSPAHISVVTWFGGGKKIGQDSFGNTYYQAKPRKEYKRQRRWVIYKGEPEATKVPPEWHGWLHHQTDTIPGEEDVSYRRPWQKSHKPNMTGTDASYLPPGHLLAGGKRDKATGDYESWSPDEDT